MQRSQTTIILSITSPLQAVFKVVSNIKDYSNIQQLPTHTIIKKIKDHIKWLSNSAILT